MVARPVRGCTYHLESGNKIYFERKTRAFDEQEVCVANLATGEVNVLIHEIDKPFMDYKMANIMFLNDGKDIIYRSERTDGDIIISTITRGF